MEPQRKDETEGNIGHIQVESLCTELVSEMQFITGGIGVFDGEISFMLLCTPY